MELIDHFKKEVLFTIVLDYKEKNYIFQFWAQNEIEAKLHWAKTIDLSKIGIHNAKEVKRHLIADAMDEDFYPFPLETPLGKLKSAWDASVSPSDFGDKEILASANIIATIPLRKHISSINKSNTYDKEQALFNFSKNKILYTIQLDYKGGSYVHQIFADDSVDAKIRWIKEFDFNVVSGVTNKNIGELKNNILLQQTEPNFAPQELQDFDSVWSTRVQLGDEIGRVTIVATKPDNFKV